MRQSRMRRLAAPDVFAHAEAQLMLSMTQLSQYNQSSDPQVQLDRLEVALDHLTQAEDGLRDLVARHVEKIASGAKE